jgi:hypothetical protein
MSLFAADIRTRCAINLRKPPLSRKRKAWTDPDNYIETQALARNAREQSIDAIVYESVRDPQHGNAVAVLTPKPLHGPVGHAENWFLTVTRDRAIWQRALGEGFEFGFQSAA